MKFQIVGYTLGVLITIIGLGEVLPAMIDWRYEHDNALIFFFNSVICLFIGGGLVLANRNQSYDITVRQTFMLTFGSWVVVSGFCALPLYMSDLDLSYADAFFEAASGVTTTGSTVLSGLDQMSHGILVWRSIMQWVGGLGIVAFALVLLPYLKVGGMQLFRTEASGHSEKVLPRSTEIVGSLLRVYALITALCATTYYMLGMSFFDAINHAMTTVSTGGYSTHDRSMGHFESPAIEYAATVFMLMGSIPFVLYIRLLFHQRFLFLRDEQVKALFIGLAVSTAVMSLWLWLHSAYTLETSFRYCLFSIVSVVTTTGYAISDYTTWGGFAILVFLGLTYVGACAGSTAGGLKVMRLVIAGKVVARQFKTLLYPHGMFVLNYQGRRLDDATIMSVMGFLSLYVGANVLMTLLLTLTGLDFETALSGTATAIANVGPGIGTVIGPSGTFASLPDISKWILSLGMIMGRLEILTVLVLMSATYWKK